MANSDSELIAALYRGDVAALGALYDRYSTLVYGLALRILTQPQEAEDLTQEVFLSLHRGRRYDSNRGSLSSYLATLTRSRAIDRLRTRSNRQSILARWQRALTPARSHLPFEQASMQERREQVQAALAQLPVQQRQVLELSYYEGLSQSEIAQQLDKPLGTVKSWARRGLLSLRDQLDCGTGALNDV